MSHKTTQKFHHITSPNRKLEAVLKHHADYLRERAYLHPKLFVTDHSIDNCRHLALKGYWANWTQHGFLRTDPEDNPVFSSIEEAYPDVQLTNGEYTVPLGKRWTKKQIQNYTGRWESIDGCRLSEMSMTDLGQCFTGKRVMVLGDSRARQIFKSLRLFLSDNREINFADTSGSITKTTIEHFNVLQKYPVELEYWFSTSQLTGHLTKLNAYLQTVIDRTGMYTDPSKKPPSLIIINEHLLHPLIGVNRMPLNITEEQFIQKYLRTHYLQELINMRQKLEQIPNLTIIMLPCMVAARPELTQGHIINYANMYNELLHQAIVNNTDVQHERFLWLGAHLLLSTSPDGLMPLLPDGTHLHFTTGWDKSPGPLRQAQLSLDILILNLHCGQKVLNSTEFCCHKSERR